jgi:hypothetical protein
MEQPPGRRSSLSTSGSSPGGKIEAISPVPAYIAATGSLLRDRRFADVGEDRIEVDRLAIGGRVVFHLEALELTWTIVDEDPDRDLYLLEAAA